MAWMDPKAVRRSETEMHFGVAAAKQALADSGFEITDANRTEVGVIFGSGAGGQQLMIENFTTLPEKGPNRVQPTFIANALVDSTSGMIAIETGAIGHNICIVSACATGTHNVGEAAEAIRRGDCIAVITGSTEAPLLEVAHAGFTNMRGMGLPRPGEPLQTVSRPFDATRDGFVLGEGAGSLFLEDLELAKARGAKIYAEVVGYGSAADGWDMIQPIEGGIGSARAMKMALDRRGVPADEVDLINPHGTSTPLGDKREAEAIWAVFGDRSAGARRSLAISGTKSMTGHMMGAAGAFEAFATVKSVAEQTVPGTLNYRDADPACDLWVVPETTRMPVRYALSEQHRAGRPQRRHHLQALRRRLSRSSARRTACSQGSPQSIRSSAVGATLGLRGSNRTSMTLSAFRMANKRRSESPFCSPCSSREMVDWSTHGTALQLLLGPAPIQPHRRTPRPMSSAAAGSSSGRWVPGGRMPRRSQRSSGSSGCRRRFGQVERPRPPCPIHSWPPESMPIAAYSSKGSGDKMVVSGAPVWVLSSKGMTKQSTPRSPAGSPRIRGEFAAHCRRSLRSRFAPPYAPIGIESARWEENPRESERQDCATGGRYNPPAGVEKTDHPTKRGCCACPVLTSRDAPS